MIRFLRQTAMLVLLSCTTLVVQAQNNLISNPSFEDEAWGTYGIKHWYFDQVLRNVSRLTEENPKSGTKALEITTTSEEMTLKAGKTTANGFEELSISPNVQYTFSYFYRGDVSRFNVGKDRRRNFAVRFTWYKELPTGGLRTVSVSSADDYGIYVKEHWQEKKIVVTAPSEATKLVLTFVIDPDLKQDRTPCKIVIDDLSLVADIPKPSAPTAPRVQTYQREAELSWAAVDGARYEVELDNKSYTPSSNAIALTGLKPNTSYTAKIRIHKDGASSDWTTQEFKTQALTTALEDEARTPYLRTIQDNGSCSTSLKLFYNELHSDTATFVYRVDGNIVQPVDNTLTLSQGEHTLQIEIRESNERIYILSYNLNVI